MANARMGPAWRADAAHRHGEVDPVECRFRPDVSRAVTPLPDRTDIDPASLLAAANGKAAS
jgi:hypothetical protein